MRWWRAGAVAAGAMAVIWACGGSGSADVAPGRDAGPPPTDGGDPDAGRPDAGPPDAGPPDAGPPDAGPPDAGPPDAGPPGGFVPPPAIPFPTATGWSFLGPQHGGPNDVYQVTTDQGGNIWVAGGEDGLFLMRPGATKFARFTMADGLRPYGYLPDGSDPVGPKFLKVIAVTGGPPGTVFVGYEGLPGCEDAWDNEANRPGPNGPGLAYVYKSGDADRVTVDASGKLKVVHYDIFSGPHVVDAEPDGREKLCSVFRIVWNAATNDLWFGGNHGFAWGDPNFAGNATCNGQTACSGLVEHAHPAFNGTRADGSCCDFITEDYRGVAVDPATGDVWFGGVNRTTKFHWGTVAGSKVNRFYAAESWTEDHPGQWPPPACPAPPCFAANRIDVWPDAMGEFVQVGPTRWVAYEPRPAEQKPQDLVFGIAALPNTAFVASGYLGLKQLAADGTVAKDLTSRVGTTFVGAVAVDSLDSKTLWVGNRYDHGIDRLDLSNPNNDQHYALNVFGNLANSGIEDVQMVGSGASRKVLVGFRRDTVHGVPGFVAIYSGN